MSRGAVIRIHSTRVTYNKKGGNQHKIPYTLTLTYEHPPVDNVASEYWVEVPKGLEDTAQLIRTVDEAIEMYLQAFYQKFHSKEGRRHRKRSPQMLLQYLTAQGHSLRLEDLTLADGQGFLDSLTNHFDGTRLTANQKKKYRNVVRSFGRFLHQMGIMEENAFLVVMIDD